jgi:ribosome-binding factor A
MANQTQRLRRVGDQIQRELAELIRTELKDPRVGFVTLTAVEVTSDLAHAKVWYTILGSTEDHEQSSEGLKRAAGFLRSELGRRLKIHNIPELHFHFDGSVERGIHLSQLIDQAVSGKKSE